MIGHLLYNIGKKKIINWSSLWFPKNNTYYSLYIQNDIIIRNIINKYFYKSIITNILISRTSNSDIIIEVYAVRPGLIIGDKNKILALVSNLLKIKLKIQVRINIIRQQDPDIHPYTIAFNIHEQLSRGFRFKKIANKLSILILRKRILGLKIQYKGRLSNSNMARKDSILFGTIPLNTIIANIGYYCLHHKNKHGIASIKVWVSK